MFAVAFYGVLEKAAAAFVDGYNGTRSSTSNLFNLLGRCHRCETVLSVFLYIDETASLEAFTWALCVVNGLD